MSSFETYFPNHKRVTRFPWSLYHKPLEDDLFTVVANKLPAGSTILVIGPGAFVELPELVKLGYEVSILDIDPRVIDIHKNENSNQYIKNYYLVDENFNGYPAENTFDFIYAKEVIEHLPRYKEFLSRIHKSLKPRGGVWLSTPDYGYFLLPLLEKTFLEWIAHKSGFTRKDIHPSKFSYSSLRAALLENGFKHVEVRQMPFRFALVGEGWKV